MMRAMGMSEAIVAQVAHRPFIDSYTRVPFNTHQSHTEWIEEACATCATRIGSNCLTLACSRAGPRWRRPGAEGADRDSSVVTNFFNRGSQRWPQI